MGVWAAAALLGVLSLLGAPSPSLAQVGLRADPLITGPRLHNIRDRGGRGVFSRWPQEGDRHRVRTNSSSNIEHSLAAIFRGVAYGLSTPPTTTTTTTTSTTTAPPPAPTAPATPGGQVRKYPALPTEWSDLQELLMGMSGEGSLDRIPDVFPDLGGTVEVVRAGPGASLAGSLGVAWVVHVYCAASMFTLVGLLAVVVLVRVRGADRIFPLGHHLALHLLMLTAAVSRCFHLFHDPYGTEGKLPQAVAGIVEDIGWPCLTAAIAVVVIALVQAWRHSPQPPSTHAPVTLAVITVFHFLVAISTHVLATEFPKHAGPLKAASHTATAAWGGVVGLGSCVATCRVVQALQHSQSLLTVTVARVPQEWTTHQACVSLLYAARLTLVTTLVQVLLAGLHLYGLMGPLVTIRLPPPRPWHWLGFQSVSCGMEVLAWVLLALISLPALRRAQRKRRSESCTWRGLWGGVRRGRCWGCRDTLETTRVGRPNQRGRSNSQLVRAHEGRPQLHTAPSCTPSPHKQALLRPTASDAQLLWSHARARDAPPSSCSSRPSSLVFNNVGLVRQNNASEPSATIMAPPQRAFQDHESQGKAFHTATPQPTAKEDPTAYDQHLYYNVPVTAESSPAQPSPPVKKSSNRRAERLLQGHLSVDLHGADSDDDRPRSDLASLTDYSSTEPASPGAAGDHTWSRNTATTCSSVSAANSFDLRMFEDSDGTYYQLPYSAPPPPPPPPPLTARHHYLPHNLGREPGRPGPEAQDGRKARPPYSTASPASGQRGDRPARRDVASGGPQDFVANPVYSPLKRPIVPQWPPHGTPRDQGQGFTNIQRNTSSTRHCGPQGDDLPGSRSQQGVICRDQPPQAAQGNLIRVPIAQHPPGSGRTATGDPPQPGSPLWHQRQTQPHRSGKQQPAGPRPARSAPNLEDTSPPGGQGDDPASRAPPPRPRETLSPHRTDSTTQTEAAPPNTPSPPPQPPPSHPPPVLLPPKEPDSRAKSQSGDQEHSLLHPGAQEHQEQQRSNREYSEVHPGDRDYREVPPGERDRREVHPGDRDRREVYPINRERCEVYSGERNREHRQVHPGDSDRREIHPVDRERREARPGDREYREVYPDSLDDREIHPFDRQYQELQPGELGHREAHAGDCGRREVYLGEVAYNEAHPDDCENREVYPGDRDCRELRPGNRERCEVYPGDRDRSEVRPGDRERREGYTGDRERREVYPGDRDRGEVRPGDRERREVYYPGDRERREVYPGDRDRGEVRLGDRERREVYPGDRESQVIAREYREVYPKDRQPREVNPGDRHHQGLPAGDRGPSVVPQGGDQCEERRV